jgi:hypothetical protein
MSSIVFDNHGRTFGGRLTGRVLIGRKLSHGVVSDDPAVSRLHAWIDPMPDSPGRWIITDAGSKGGTRVDGQPVTQHELKPGDVIAVGPLRIRFDSIDDLGDGVEILALTPPSGPVQTPGVLFECSCGAPIWAGDDLAGKRGMCRHCRRPIVVPQRGIITTKPAAAPGPGPSRKSGTGRMPRCGVCHAEIRPGEADTSCMACDIRYHAECWEENGGCSTYGCPQVNSLINPPIDEPATAPAAVEPETAPGVESAAAIHDPLPRASMIPLAMFLASLLTMLVGAIAFGVPSLLVAVASAILWLRDKRVLLIAAVALGLLGFAAGLAVSDWWYLNAKHLMMLKR